MYSIGCDSNEGYDFNSEENKKKWRELFIPSLRMIQKSTHPDLTVKDDGLQYVNSLILRLLCSLVQPPNNSVMAAGSTMNLHTISDVEERIKRLFPNPLDVWSIRKAHETVSALKYYKKSKANSRYCAERSSLKTPVEKFHNLFQKELLGYKTDIQVSQFILAILEYIATDILKLSCNYVRNMTHLEITSQDIGVAMCADKVLMDMFYKDVDEVDGPPPSAGFHCHQSFFDSWELADGEYGNVGSRKSLTYLDAAKELIQEERQFIRDLNLIIKVFRDPLMRILSTNDMDIGKKIFANIDDVYEFSDNFLGLLEDAVEVTDDENCPAIGACFEETAECFEFDVFEKYAQEVMSPSCRRNLCYLLSNQNIANAINNTGHGMLAAFRYVLPRLLLVPVFHCFSYFKAIENFKELNPPNEDKESFVQAEGLLMPLKNQLESLNKRHKSGELYFLHLYGRTNRATAMAKMTEIQKSIDDWDGKDIWQSCNKFIFESSLFKLSGLQSRSSKVTERHAFLFDGLLVLCKASNKRSTGNSRDSNAEWRLKERFLIRNLEIVDCSEFCDRNSNFYLPASPPSCNSGGDTSPGFFTQDQSFSSLSSTLTSSSININSNSESFNTSNGLTSNLPYAFQISLRNQPAVILVAKTVEEKDLWMSQLILLNLRPMLERTLDSRLLDEANKLPLQLPHPSVYRFAIEDLDSNIILEEGKSNSNVPLIKGATLLKLIERLTYHKYGDPVFVRTFLTTYRTFCTPSLLLDLLIERFEIPDPDFRWCMLAVHYANGELASPTSIHPQLYSYYNNNEQTESDTCSIITCPTSPTSPTHSVNLPSTPFDLNTFFDEQDEQCKKDYNQMLKRFRKEYTQPVQFRVLNVLRHWIDNHYYDFERDEQLLEKLIEFLDEKVATGRNMRKWCTHIHTVLQRKKLEQSQENMREVVISFQSPPPQIEWWIARPTDVESFDLLTLHPVEVARQLTLLEFDLYRAVKPSELIGAKSQTPVFTQKDKNEKSPKLMKMIRHNSIFTFYLEKCIVEAENFEERVAMMTRIIEIMLVLQELNNFNGVFEVMSALNSAPIHRLEHTRAHVNSKLKKACEEAQELMDSHFKKYKEKLGSINPPCVPFFGLYLTNILHIEEGNPEYLLPNDTASMHESSLILDETVSGKFINFNKKRKVAEIMSQIQLYQNQPYCLKVEPSIRSFLENLDPCGDMNDDEFNILLFNKTLELEPRGSRQANRFPRRWPDRLLKSPGNTVRNKILNHIPSFEPIANLANNLANSVVNNHSHGSHNNNSSSHNDSDIISLQQQQSPSTPLTPAYHGSQSSSFVNDPVFASVMIGGMGNITPGLSPTLTTSFNFPSVSSLANQPPLPTPPPPPTPSSVMFSQNNFPPNPPPLPPRTNRTNFQLQQSPRSRIQPPLPSQSKEEEVPISPTSSSPPPLPPRSHSITGPMTRSLSMQTCRDPAQAPPPLRPLPHHSNQHSFFNYHPPHSQYIHQRVNSDIILSGGTTNNNNTNGGTIVRRNSTMEPLPPRRFSHGGIPPPLPPVPNSPTSPGLFCNTSTTSPPSTPSAMSHPAPPPPPPPPIPPLTPSAISHAPPPPPILSTSPVPELPPKTYRLSNV